MPRVTTPTLMVSKQEKITSALTAGNNVPKLNLKKCEGQHFLKTGNWLALRSVVYKTNLDSSATMCSLYV